MNKQQTEMKEYLSQAFRIDQRIQSKMEQVASLNDLATRATATYSDMPGSETRNLHRMEDAILSIIGSAHTLARLAHGGIRQADELKARQAAGDAALDHDGISADAGQAHGIHA